MSCFIIMVRLAAIALLLVIQLAPPKPIGAMPTPLLDESQAKLLADSQEFNKDEMNDLIDRFILESTATTTSTESSIASALEEEDDKEELEPANQSQSGNNDCVVCNEPLGDAKGVISASCNHSFHEQCFEKWTEKVSQEKK